MCTPGGGAATAKSTEKLAPKNLGGIPSANAKVLFLPATYCRGGVAKSYEA